MRVGLVLGAGGVIGASWLIGALEALESETGWSPSEADVIVGTSAGSVIGSLSAGGLSPALMAAYVGGGSLDELAQNEDRGDGLAARIPGGVSGVEYRLALALPPIGPGSWRMAVSTLLRPMRHAPSAVLAGWLPRGFVSTKPITDLVETHVAGDWPDHDAFWAVASDYRTGKRVVFGRDDAPPARVGDGVAASCAVPGFYHPVKIGGRRYIDGGVCSASNLDLLCDADLDMVVCLNPMSSLAKITPRSPADRVAAIARWHTGRRLSHEAKKLRESGTELLVLQPTGEDLAIMGPNLMARSRREQVVERAVRTTARQLRRRRDRDGVPMPARTKLPARRRVSTAAAGRTRKAA